MAITAKFIADFEAFIKSTRDAEQQVKNLEKGGKDLGLTFDSIKSGAMQLAGAFGIAFSVKALVGFGQDLIATAGALTDLNLKTGVSIEQLQRWAFVGAQAGVSTEQFADAAFKLGVKLAGGSGSVRDAVEKLGLSYEQLKAMSPDDQFNTIVRALEAMEDPQERNRLGVELFAKTFATIAPAVAKGYTEMASQAQVSSAAQIKAIDEASDAWDRFVSRQKSNITSWLGNAVMAREAVSKLTTEQQLEYALLLKTGQDAQAFLLAASKAQADSLLFIGPIQEKQTEKVKDYTIELAYAMVAVNHLSKAEVAGVEAAIRLGKSHEDITNELGVTEGMIKVIIERTQERTKATTDAAAAAKKAADIEAAAILGVSKLREEYYELIVKQGGTANEIAIAGITKWAADVTAAAVKAKTDTADFYDWLAVNSQTKLAAVGINWSLWKTNSIAALNEVAENERRTMAEMLASGGFHRDEIEKQRQKYEDARNAARGYGDTAVAAQKAAADAVAKQNAELVRQLAAIEALKKANREMGNSTEFDLSTESGRAAVPEGIRVWLHDGYSLAQATQIDFLMRWGLPINANDPLFRNKGPRVPGFAGGVENFAGGMALVGERGPELVNLPRGSDVIPMGRGGGVVNHFYLVDNSENLARRTANLIIASVKRGKQLGV